MNGKRRKAVLVLVAAVIALGLQAMPAGTGPGSFNQVYGAFEIAAEMIGSVSALQGAQNVLVNF